MLPGIASIMKKKNTEVTEISVRWVNNNSVALEGIVSFLILFGHIF